MKVFFNAIVIHLIFNIYVFIRGWKIIPPKQTWRIPYAALFAVELIIYLLGFFLWEEFPSEWIRPVTLLGTSWMILIGFLTALLLLYNLVRWILKKRKSKRIKALDKLKTKRIYFLVSLSIVIAAMIYGNYCFWHPEVTKVNIEIDKKVEGLTSLKVVMVSDVHAGWMIDKQVLSMYVDKIMELKPDMIVLVGDIIDYDLPPLVEQQMDEEFKKLHAPYGVYASTGNHEYRLNAEEKIAWLNDKAGLTMLRDTALKVQDKFYVIGREDDLYLDRKDLTTLMQGIDPLLPIIVLNHEPKKISEESDAKVDLALYGHTHNGQLFPYNIVLKAIYEVPYGYKKKDDTHIFVSSGLGLAGPQYRIGTKSEIVEINIKFAQ